MLIAFNYKAVFQYKINDAGSVVSRFPDDIMWCVLAKSGSCHMQYLKC